MFCARTSNRRVKYLSIGNEVDVYLTTHPQEWGAYQSFYREGVAYVHAVAPWIKVGVTVTYDGAVKNRGHVADLNSQRDVFILTYYPLGARFSPRRPDSPITDLPKMVELAKKRPLILQEVGYPSSTELSSSEAMQAQFVTSVFRAWEECAPSPLPKRISAGRPAKAEVRGASEVLWPSTRPELSSLLVFLGAQTRRRNAQTGMDIPGQRTRTGGFK